MKADNGFGAACSPNSDFLLSAIFFDIILYNRNKHTCGYVVPHRLELVYRVNVSVSRLPDSFSAALSVHCRSSSRTWAAHPGPTVSCVNGPRGFQTFYPPVGRPGSSQNEDSCNGLMSDVTYAFSFIIKITTTVKKRGRRRMFWRNSAKYNHSYQQI